MKKTLEEFKKFALKGNVMDMAVGVMIGGAFGKIVSSLVNDIVMPCISLLIGKVNFTSMQFVLANAGTEHAVILKYGVFLQNVFDFLVIAICIFSAVKLISRYSKKEEEVVAPVKISGEEALLTEIRDLLKNK